MAEFEQAGATERLRRVAILRDMQSRLQRNPAEALGVAPNASPAALRSAFMALTKQYHPAKFARLDEATVRLANEVFLAMRDAYEALRASAMSQPSGPRSTRLGSEAGLGSALSMAASAQGSPGASSLRAMPTNGPASGASGASAARPGASSASASAGPSSAIAAAAARSAGARSAAPSTTSPGPAAPTSASKPVASFGVSSARLALAPAPSAPATSVRPAAAPTSAAAPPPAAAGNGKPAPPLMIRFGSPAAPPPQELSDGARQAHALIARKQWKEARSALQVLAQREPNERRHLAWLSYVRACEAIEAGNPADGRRELVRALAIEPTLEAAKQALAELNAPRR